MAVVVKLPIFYACMFFILGVWCISVHNASFLLTFKVSNLSTEELGNFRVKLAHATRFHITYAYTYYQIIKHVIVHLEVNSPLISKAKQLWMKSGFDLSQLYCTPKFVKTKLNGNFIAKFFYMSVLIQDLKQFVV